MALQERPSIRSGTEQCRIFLAVSRKEEHADLLVPATGGSGDPLASLVVRDSVRFAFSSEARHLARVPIPTRTCPSRRLRYGGCSVCHVSVVRLPVRHRRAHFADEGHPAVSLTFNSMTNREALLTMLGVSVTAVAVSFVPKVYGLVLHLCGLVR